MAESLDLIHSSGGLIAPGVLAAAVSDAPRASEFGPGTFALPDEEAPSPRAHAEIIETSFALACEQYDKVRQDLDRMDTGPLREKWLRPLMQILDFEPMYQRSRLRSEDGRDSFAISHLGLGPGDHAPPMILMPNDLDEAPSRGRRSPHDELQQFLNRSSLRWGIAANGRRLRILRDFFHSHLKGFVGFDLDHIFEERDFPAFRALYRLAHASRFVPGEKDKCVLDRLFDASQAEGVLVGRKLQEQVRRAIEALAEGLFSAELRELLGDPKEARGLYRELLLIVYRILFLLFAEQRRMLPPTGIYAETYSLAALTRTAERRSADLRHRDLWEGLKATFNILQQGAESLGVFPYNGQLFDPARTARLTAQTCENRYLFNAIKALTQIRIEGIRQRVNYAELGVEELGSVYESLLNYTLRRAERPTESSGHVVPAGGVYLAPLTTERKDLGAYYTPPKLVDFALSVSLDHLMEERLAEAGDDREAQKRALLDIRACDPACGSGAFLVGAIDRLALRLADVRAADAQPTEEAVQHARRDVLRHCIYGVDKDVFAVELCKVALWIHCAVPDMPLSFLDHKIQHGDSLVGWPLLGIPNTIPTDAYKVPSKIRNSRRAEDRRLREFLGAAREQADQVNAGQMELLAGLPMPHVEVDFPVVLEEEERIPADVERKTAAFNGYLQSPAYRKFKAAADLWTAAFFWSPEIDAPAPTTADYRRILRDQSEPDVPDGAAELLDEFPAFHWPLAFPEIRARGGFDLIIGNPPWEQVKLQEEEWFAPRRPDIATMRTTPRREAIEGLEEQDPHLARLWRMTQVAYDRLAEYMRNSGRFTASGHEPNTYLLFGELVADFLRRGGRAGVLLKSALALDKTASGVLHKILGRGQLAELHDIVNGGATGTNMIFPAVDGKHRFSVTAMCGETDSRSFRCTVMNWNVEEALTRPHYRFTREALRTLNPNTGTLTSFRRIEELDVALDVHRRLPILDFEQGGNNPWGLSYHRLFDSSTASRRFLRREDLEVEGWTLGEDRIFRRRRGTPNGLFDGDDGCEEALPLYEGQLANRYDHRARTYEGYGGTNKYSRSPGCPWTTDSQKSDPAFEVEPRYWIDGQTARNRLAHTVGDRAMIGFRDVVHWWRTKRAAMGAILPRYPATDTVPILAVAMSRALAFVGLFNSTTFDFLVRGHMPGAHVKTVWMLSQIAAPPPGLDVRLTENAAKLSLTSHTVAEPFGRGPQAWDPQERYVLDVEIDALVAHAYGLTRDQYEIVLDSFEVMARMQTAEHGRYKFKEDCLDAYGRLG